MIVYNRDLLSIPTFPVFSVLPDNHLIHGRHHALKSTVTTGSHTLIDDSV